MITFSLVGLIGCLIIIAAIIFIIYKIVTAIKKRILKNKNKNNLQTNNSDNDHTI